MSRPFRARALAAVLLIAAAGCQDYNFNPVGHCVLQPGTQKFTLSNVSSADVLFVVDDSGSMAGEQDRLADAFADFVGSLTATNLARAQGGLLPLDFHVAVTSTSIYYNGPYVGVASQPKCSSTCGVASGAPVCCNGSEPVWGQKKCTTLGSVDPTQCPDSATVCSDTCNGFVGDLYCCRANGTFPLGDPGPTYGQAIGCKLEGSDCGELKTHYDFGDPQCQPGSHGVAFGAGFPYPDGAFVGSTSLATANPRVLHFDKRLYLSSAGKNAQGFTMAELKRFFEQNVRVGTCGSKQEQGLQASRRAIDDAYAGKQLDTFAYDWAQGLSSAVSPSDPNTLRSFSVTNGIPRPGARAIWPTPNSKLVVVYVGDEDDCSAPNDPSAGVVLASAAPGQDACTRDGTLGAPPKEYTPASFASYLTGFGRPVGAAFVVSATSAGNDTDCRNDLCVPNICCDKQCVADLYQANYSDPNYPPLCGDRFNPGTCVCSYDSCGGQAPGTRFIETAKQLKGKGADVVVGSVCGDFKLLLREVAEIVKPPQTLSLPSLPAEGAITILRIVTSSGQTRKICAPALKPERPNYDRTSAEATGADWWFVEAGDPGPPFDPTPTATAATVSAPTRFVYINPRGSCIANPGETYSADYLGVVPAGGCVVNDGDFDNGLDGIHGTADDPSPARVLGSVDCQAKMGGRFSDWECHVPDGLTIGTCTCRSGS